MTPHPGDVEGRVRTIVGSVRRGIEVDLESSWRQLGLDSLDLLEVVTRAEDEFRVTIPDRVVVRLRSPAELAAHVQSVEVMHEGRDTSDRRLVEIRPVVELQHGHAGR